MIQTFPDWTSSTNIFRCASIWSRKIFFRGRFFPLTSFPGSGIFSFCHATSFFSACCVEMIQGWGLEH